MYAGLGDGDAALLHHLVDGCPVDVGHLVKLVDADHTPAFQVISYKLKARKRRESLNICC